MLKALNAEDRGAIFENTTLFTHCPKRLDTADIWTCGRWFCFRAAFICVVNLQQRGGYRVSTTNVYSLDTSEIIQINDCET